MPNPLPPAVGPELLHSHHRMEVGVRINPLEC